MYPLHTGKSGKRAGIIPVIPEGGVQRLQMIGALFQSYHVVASRRLDVYFIGGEMTVNLFSN